MNDDEPKPDDAQVEKFKKAAREHHADEDEARWAERLRKIAKAKPKNEEQS
jgi:hypothetical protein